MGVNAANIYRAYGSGKEFVSEKTRGADHENTIDGVCYLLHKEVDHVAFCIT